MNNSAKQGCAGQASSPEPRLVSALPYRMKYTAPRRPKVIATWVAEMFTAGRLGVRADGGPWQLFGQGEGVLYRAGVRFQEKSVPAGSVCHSFGLHFEIGESPTFDGWRTLTPRYRKIDDPRGLLTPLVKQVVQHHQLPGADAMLAQGAFLQTIGHLLNAQPRGDRLVVAAGDRHEDLLTRTHRLMHENIGRSISVADLAAAMGMSESGFAHAYKRAAGVTPAAALRRMRIEVVQAHLTTHRLSLSEIAQLTGFADAFHLSRTFKKLVGQSPSAFRKREPRDRAAGV